MFTGQISSHALQRRAGPDLLGRDALEQRVGADRDLRVGAERRRHDRAAGGGHHLAGLQHDLAGVERLAGGVGRAHARAAAAHRAGVGVEQLLPREVLDDRGAERLELGLGEVRHRLHRALRARLVLEVHVQRRREHVAQHRDRQDRQEHDERQRRGRSTNHWWPGLQRVDRPRRRRAATAASRRSSTSRSPCSRRSAVCRAMRNISAAKPLRPMTRNVPRMSDVLGLRLDADAVRPLHVAAQRSPRSRRP